jgi:hypothetical protein
MHKGIHAAWYASLGATGALLAAFVVVGPLLYLLAAFAPLRAGAGAGLLVAVTLAMSWALARAQASGRVSKDVSAPATVVGGIVGLVVAVALLLRFRYSPLLFGSPSLLLLGAPAVSVFLGAAMAATLASPKRHRRLLETATVGVALAGGLLAYQPSAIIGEPSYGPGLVPPTAAAGPPPPHRYLSLSSAGVRAVGDDGTVVGMDGSTGRALSAYGPDDRLRWSVSGLEPVAIARGTNGDTIVRTRGGQVTAFDADARIRWDYDPRPQIVTVIGPGADGTVFTHNTGPNQDGAIIRAIDLSGRVRDVVRTRAEAGRISVTSDGGLLAQSGSLVVQVDAAGTEQWRVDTGTESLRVVRTAGGLVAAGFSKVRAFDTSGRERWSVPLQGGSGIEQINHLVVMPTGRVYAQSSSLWAIENGQQLWHWKQAWLMGRPVVEGDGTVYTRDQSGTIYAIGPDGTLRWMWQPVSRPGDQNYPQLDMWLSRSRVLFASVGPRLVALDLSAGERADRGAR